ncbi:DUF397 domain-containing protein [Actinomadura terrae]|uniref:DUF397 domain-containing protein n=1 Tax=Actinomadura terrae TaxID=604353 RepID=UPI001FA7AA42|nr:DUF397 domain-containing protein [Actinomadura terrae]
MDLSVAVWRKASRSHEDGDACVEVANLAEFVTVRDSKDPEGPKLILSRDDFRRFAYVLKEA